MKRFFGVRNNVRNLTDSTIHMDYISVHDSLCVRKTRLQHRKGTRSLLFREYEGIGAYFFSKLEPIIKDLCI